MIHPKVSVAIPTYNHEKYIEKTIESVVSQTTSFPFEVLVGDDASCDNTKNIVQSFVDNYPEIVKPVFRDKNIGGQRNRNYLYVNSRGKYIVVLDGDDFMYPGKLQKQYDLLESNPSCGSVFHNMDIIKEDGVFIRKFCDEALHRGYFTAEDFVERGTFLPHTSKMFRKDVMPEDGFPVFTDLRGLDWLHHVITSKKYMVGYLSETLGAYVKHSASTTSSVEKSNLMSHYNGHRKALDYAKKIGISEISIDIGLKRFYIMYSLLALRLGDIGNFNKITDSLCSMDGRFTLTQKLYCVISRYPKLLFLARNIYFKIKHKK